MAAFGSGAAIPDAQNAALAQAAMAINQILPALDPETYIFMLSQHMAAKSQLAAMLLKTDFALMDEDSDGSAQISELHEGHQTRETALQALAAQLVERAQQSNKRKAAKVSNTWIQQQAQDEEEEEDLDAAYLAENLAEMGDRFVGTIRSFEERNGYGFIDCEKAKEMFKSDVYIHRQQMHRLSVGDVVNFTIYRNKTGQPQAREVVGVDDKVKLQKKLLQKQGRKEQALAQKRGIDHTHTHTRADAMTEEEAKKFQASLRKRKA